MKKVLFALMVVVVAGCTIVGKEERFVNPVFYKTLEGTGHRYDTVKITPTEYYVKNYYGYSAKAKCEMLENTQEKVKLKCLHLPADLNDKMELILVEHDGEPITLTREFVVYEISDHGTYIIMYTYYEDEEKWTSRRPFITVDIPSR